MKNQPFSLTLLIHAQDSTAAVSPRLLGPLVAKQDKGSPRSILKRDATPRALERRKTIMFSPYNGVRIIPHRLENAGLFDSPTFEASFAAARGASPTVEERWVSSPRCGAIRAPPLLTLSLLILLSSPESPESESGAEAGGARYDNDDPSNYVIRPLAATFSEEEQADASEEVKRTAEQTQEPPARPRLMTQDETSPLGLGCGESFTGPCKNSDSDSSDSSSEASSPMESNSGGGGALAPLFGLAGGGNPVQANSTLGSGGGGVYTAFTVSTGKPTAAPTTPAGTATPEIAAPGAVKGVISDMMNVIRYAMADTSTVM